MAGCYRVRVGLGGHHFELVVVADDPDGAAAKARVLVDGGVRANSCYWPGDPVVPLVGPITFEHDCTVHGSTEERRVMAALRRVRRGEIQCRPRA